MQADARLVQNIQYPHQVGTDLRRQPDALALAAGQRTRRPRKIQVAEPHALQEAQPLPDFLEDTVGNPVLPFVQFQLFNERQRVLHGFFRKIRDIDTADRHREAFRPQTLACAFRAGHLRHMGLQLLLHPVALRFPVAALQIIENPLKIGVVFTLTVLHLAHHTDFLTFGAVQQDIDNFRRQLAHRRIQGKAVMRRQRLVIHLGNGAAIGVAPAARLNRTAADGQTLVRNNQIRIHRHKNPQPCALRTGPEGIVEGKHPRGQLFNTHAVLRTGIVLGKGHFLPADHIHRQQAAGQRGCRFDGISQPPLDLVADYQPVDHHFNGVLFVFLQLNLFRKIINIAVHPDPHIAGLARRVEFLNMLALAPAYHRSKQLNPRPGLQCHDLIHNLIHRLLPDLPPADRAVRDADAGIQQPEIVVDLGHRPHRRARIFGGRLLINGNCRRQPLDIIHVRLFHLAEELPRIGGQALDIPPLPLRINRVKGQRGLARTGQTGKDNKLVTRYIKIDIFQVVLPGPFDNQSGILHIFAFLFPCSPLPPGAPVILEKRGASPLIFSAFQSHPAARRHARIPAALLPPSFPWSAAQCAAAVRRG